MTINTGDIYGFQRARSEFLLNYTQKGLNISITLRWASKWLAENYNSEQRPLRSSSLPLLPEMMACPAKSHWCLCNGYSTVKHEGLLFPVK